MPPLLRALLPGRRRDGRRRNSSGQMRRDAIYIPWGKAAAAALSGSANQFDCSSHSSLATLHSCGGLGRRNGRRVFAFAVYFYDDPQKGRGCVARSRQERVTGTSPLCL
ncbi:hypothetical protein MRX96_056110 [Rhipicephalus microplus]